MAPAAVRHSPRERYHQREQTSATLHAVKGGLHMTNPQVGILERRGGTAPQLRRPLHEGFPVRDAEVSLKFYTEVLGLQVLPRPNIGPGYWVGTEDKRVEFHIIETDSQYIPGPDTIPVAQARHTAWLVDSLQELRTHLDSLGVAYREQKGRVGADQVFIIDPDGHTWEFRSRQRCSRKQLTSQTVRTATTSTASRAKRQWLHSCLPRRVQRHVQLLAELCVAEHVGQLHDADQVSVGYHGSVATPRGGRESRQPGSGRHGIWQRTHHLFDTRRASGRARRGQCSLIDQPDRRAIAHDQQPTPAAPEQLPIHRVLQVRPGLGHRRRRSHDIAHANVLQGLSEAQVVARGTRRLT